MTRNKSYAALPIAGPPHPKTEDCPDPECYVCGQRDCPFHEPLHYHHDGCPVCSQWIDAIEAGIRQAWPTVTALDRDVLVCGIMTTLQAKGLFNGG